MAKKTFFAIPGQKSIMIKKFFRKKLSKFFLLFLAEIDNANWPEKVFYETRCIRFWGVLAEEIVPQDLFPFSIFISDHGVKNILA